jgi:SAM-dependent methyltransferase
MNEQPVQYAFEGDERPRLDAVEEFLDEGTRRLIADLGIGPGAQCLEVGAGGGSIARWLSDLVGPTGHVVATDVDTRFLKPLADRSNLEIRQHDLTADPLEEGTFDFVHARLVVEHLAKPDDALAKLVRALRPGALIMIEDADHVCVVPVSELGAVEFERMNAVRISEFERLGLDPWFARSLPARLRAQGLCDLGNEGRAYVTRGGTAGARWSLLSVAHLRGRLVGAGKLTDAELDYMLELFDDPNWEALSLLLLAAWGRRPS